MSTAAIYVLLLALLLLPRHSQQVWKCELSRFCPPNLEHPQNEEDMAREMETVDALAEWKYRYTCGGVSDENVTYPLPSGLHNCGQQDGSAEPDLFLKDALRQMQQGHNVVTDKGGFGWVLNLTSSHIRNATLLHPVNKQCYRVSDALSSSHSQSVGVSFRSYFPTVYKSFGTSNFSEYRETMARLRYLEFDLGAEEYAILFRAAFSGILDNWADEFKELKRTHVFYSASAVQLYVLNPMPTVEIVETWKRLFQSAQTKSLRQTEIDDDFDYYFKYNGTHYVVSAAVGGSCDSFSTWEGGDDPNSTHRRVWPPHIKSDPKLLAVCDAAEKSVHNLKLSASVAKAACDAAQVELNHGEGHGEMRSWLCDGGSGDHRVNSDGHEKFGKWLDDMKTGNRNLFYHFAGRKHWIPQLVETVLHRAEEEEYKWVLQSFGGQDDMEQNKARLQEFKNIFSLQLKSYLYRKMYLKP